MLDMERTDLTLVCQTTLSVPEGQLDTGNVSPLANVASAEVSESVAVGSPTFVGGGGHDTDSSIMDEGSIEDDERSTWTDWCDSAFYTVFGTFPSAADGCVQGRTVVGRGVDRFGLFGSRGIAYVDITDSLEPSVTVIPPVVDWPVQRIMDGLVGKGLCKFSKKIIWLSLIKK